MKNILLAMSLSLPLLIPTVKPVQNVQERTIESVAYLDGKTGHCTAFSVAAGEWLTESHCLRMFPASQINGKDTAAIKVDDKVGLALLSGPPARPLPIADAEPRLGEPTTMYGWPGDWPAEAPLIFFGHVQAVGVGMSIGGDPGHAYNFFHEGGGPGMSGGPIVDETGAVVGVTEGAGQYPSISVASPTVKLIRKFLSLK